MPLWIIPTVIVLIAILVLNWTRLKIPRDPGKEEAENPESILAYDHVSRWFLFSFIRYFIIRQLKKYPLQGTLLDAGCGPGYLDFALAREFPRLNIIGLDISKEMIGLANKNRPSTNLANRIKFLEDNIENLSLQDNSIDFVVSSLSLHHWSASDKALAEIFRVLRPAGQFLIFDLRRDPTYFLYYAVYVVQRLFSPPAIRQINGGIGSILASYTPPEMKALLDVSPLQEWKVQAGWAWAYLWGRK